MRTQDVVLILLAVVVLFLLLQKVVSSFTSNDVQTFQSNFVYAGQSDLGKVIDFYIASLNGQPLLPIVNGILTSVPPTNGIQPAQPLVPYTSESQLSTMFGDASKNGESGLTFTDRYLLRYLTLFCIFLFNNSGPVIGTVTWDAQGKPSFADDVLQKNQSIQDNMKIVFELFKTMFAGGGDGQLTQNAVDTINTILPPNLTKFSSVQDFNTRQATMNSGANRDPSTVFVIKYVMVGPAYLSWVAQNQYKLDPAFKCFNVAAKQPMDVSVPTPAPPKPSEG
jgi:hypothetical protein